MVLSGLTIDAGPVLFCLSTVPVRFQNGSASFLERRRFWNGSGTVPERFQNGSATVPEQFRNGSGTKQHRRAPTPVAMHDVSMGQTRLRSCLRDSRLRVDFALVES